MASRSDRYPLLRLVCRSAVVVVLAVLVAVGLVPGETSQVPGDGRRSGSEVLLAPGAVDRVAARSPLRPSAVVVDATEYRPGLISTTVGQLSISDRSEGGSCTATVVASHSGLMAVTAAHCVFRPDEMYGIPTPAAERGWVRDIEFIAGRNGREAPFGVWQVARVQVDPRWQRSASPEHDIAFLKLAPRDGQTAQQVLGAQGIGVGQTQPARELTAVGYPTEGRFPGDRPYRCASENTAVDRRLGGGYRMKCDMTAGASGGPWLAELDEDQGLGVVVAVSTLIYTDRPRVGAARIDGTTMQIYQELDRAGLG